MWKDVLVEMPAYQQFSDDYQDVVRSMGKGYGSWNKGSFPEMPRADMEQLLKAKMVNVPGRGQMSMWDLMNESQGMSSDQTRFDWRSVGI